jgi:hypothetical protein
VGQTSGILGQGLIGKLNATPVNFTVISDSYIQAQVPTGATSGYVTATAPNAMLKSNVPFWVMP